MSRADPVGSARRGQQRRKQRRSRQASSGILVRHDPLYGRVDLPSYLGGLLSCWEIQRLRYVRLLNVNSVPLAALGETSRYSHVIGVLHLGLALLTANGISPDDAVGKLLMCALALHDMGTPAFGHSFEYVLKGRGLGDHVEAAIARIKGTSEHLGQFCWKPALYERGARNLRRELRKLLGRSFEELLEQALRGSGPVGHLVSSNSIDLDNIDNVFRMADALGIRQGWEAQTPLSLVGSIDLDQQHGLLACSPAVWPAVESWQRIRHSVYQLLNLDHFNLAGLAMLREAFEEYVLVHGLPDDNSIWWTVDNEVLGKIALRHTASLVRRIERGDLYNTLACIQISTKTDEMQPIEHLVSELREFSYRLSESLDTRVRVHALLDRATFQRKVKLFVDGSAQEYGEDSRSLVVSIHPVGRDVRVPPELAVARLMELLQEWFPGVRSSVSQSIVFQSMTNTAGQGRNVYNQLGFGF